MSRALAYFKGKVVPIEDANVNVMTHALHYGTAVFEGIRGNWNPSEEKLFIFRIREHYERLLQGCQMLMLDIPYSADELCDITIDLVKQCGYKQDLYIRPLAYKSEELVANLKLQEVSSDFTLIMVPFGEYLETDGALKCCTSSWRRFVSEGSGENLFMINDGVIITPPVSDNNLTGITRDSAMEIAKRELGIEVIEARIRRSELYFADEVFLTGTAAHIQAVGTLDNRKIGSGESGPITNKINEIYQMAIRGQNPDYMDWCTAVNI